MEKIRLLLVEDHSLVRAGFRALLQQLPDMEVVAETDNGRDAIRLVEQHKPDLVLMDISMHELNGLEAVSRIMKTYPGTRVMMLSMHEDEEYVTQAVRAGAAGYVVKSSSTNDLELAIRTVLKGEPYFSPPISKLLIDRYIKRIAVESNDTYQLTPRQREILQLIVEGHTTQQIADTLNISVKTAESHRAQLMERLDIHDIPGLVRYAIKIGLITVD
ncbi:MAG: response regulator transcription factor [Chloroflexota bacterium]